MSTPLAERELLNAQPPPAGLWPNITVWRKSVYCMKTHEWN